MKLIPLNLLILILTTVVFSVGNATENDKTLLEQVQTKLKMSFANVSASHFGKSPIEGVYELMAGSRLIYYVPANDVLIFGELFSKEGRSLTAERVALLQNDKIQKLDLSKALVLGKGEKTLIEFTDPDCPYCRMMHSQLRNESNITRLIFFSIVEDLHPEAKQKAVHILCADNKAKAFDDVFAQQVAPLALQHCKEGEQILSSHQAISTSFGVAGTPTVILGNSVVTGFRQAQIAQFLEN